MSSVLILKIENMVTLHVSVESRSALDQNTSWVIVEIPPEKILLEQIV